jgi:hypothetical protein
MAGDIDMTMAMRGTEKRALAICTNCYLSGNTVLEGRIEESITIENVGGR